MREWSRWFFPLNHCPGIPINFHPGSFGFPRMIPRKGQSHVIPQVEVGDEVNVNQVIALVSTVIQEGKERPDIPGHSRSMLHLELYDRGTKAASTSWKQGRTELGLRDPTPYLVLSVSRPKEFLMWDGV